MKNQGYGPENPQDNAHRNSASECLAPPAPLYLFPGIPFEYVEILKSRGIKDSGSFLQVTRTHQHRTDLTTTTGIPAYRIDEIRSLCDLSRIRGIGPEAARVLYYANIRSVEQLANETVSAIFQNMAPYFGNFAEVNQSMKERNMADYIRCARIIALNDERTQE